MSKTKPKSSRRLLKDIPESNEQMLTVDIPTRSEDLSVSMTSEQVKELKEEPPKKIEFVKLICSEDK